MKQLGELAAWIGARLLGDTDLQISGARSILQASRNDITFVSAEKYLGTFIESDSPAAVITNQIDLDRIGRHWSKSFLQVDDAESSFIKIVKLFRPPGERTRVGISQRANISHSAEIAEDVDVYPGASIGDKVRIGCGSIIHPNVTILENTTIGANTVVFPNVVIYENCVIGNRCLIHAGAVIGGYGFGYRSAASHELCAQLGNVVIGDDVEIGCNTTIDRGTYDSTVIGSGTKLDNQVMIGHNCQIGKHNLFCSQVGIASSCVTGDYVVMAGQVGIGDHLTIGDRTTLAAQSGVMNDLQGNQTYLGSPAIPVREQMQIHALINRLPEMRKQLRQLKMANELESDGPLRSYEAA